MTNLDLKLYPRRDAILEGEDNLLDVLLSVQAPDAPEQSIVRQPFNLVLVIDRSGSMTGRPLEEAKRCAEMIVDSLQPTDRLSVVAYDHNVDVIIPSRPVGDRSMFHQALRALQSGGSTALHEGWLRGAEQASIHHDATRLTRVLLISDGRANAGLTAEGTIAAQCAELACAGVTTSTYGLGLHFNESLMAAMARRGRGNAYYGSSADDLMDPFRQEFDLLSSLCGRDLCMTTVPVAGVGVEVLNRYDTDADGAIRLPDLAYGSEAWALLRLTLPRSVIETSGPDPMHLLTVHLKYRDLEGSEQAAGPVHLRLPRLPAAAFEAIVPNELVGSRATELEAARLQEAARHAARRGDWPTVEELMVRLRHLAQASPWLRASLSELEHYVKHRQTEKFAKEALYKANALSRRLTEKEEGLDWSYEQESAKASFLRRKREQGKRFG